MQHCDASVLGIAEANFITGPKKKKPPVDNFELQFA